MPGVLATLNYDNLIEDATGRRAVTWLKADDVQDVLTRNRTDAVLHLHGWFKEPESVVLGLSSYLAVKDHPHAKAVLNLFTIDRTLLFVGCGDTVLDPNFTRLIEWGKEALKDVTPRHYLLCRTSEVGALPEQARRRSVASAARLRRRIQRSRPFPAQPRTAEGVASATSARLDRVRLGSRTPTNRRCASATAASSSRNSIRPRTTCGRSLLTGMFIAQSARECAEFMPRVFELPKELQRRLREAGELEGADWTKKHSRSIAAPTSTNRRARSWRWSTTRPSAAS